MEIGPLILNVLPPQIVRENQHEIRTSRSRRRLGQRRERQKNHAAAHRKPKPECVHDLLRRLRYHPDLVKALVIIGAIVVATTYRAGAPAQSQMDVRMNVLVLVIDDMRWDSLGAAGNRVVRTPRLDRLAARGVRFAQARVTTSICMVSRASLLTGQYMSRHGITGSASRSRPRRSRRPIPGLLRRPATGPGTSASTMSASREPTGTTSSAPITAGTGSRQPDGARSTSRRRTRATRSTSCGSGRRTGRSADRRVLRPARRGPRPGAVPAADWSAKLYEGVTVPPSPLGGADSCGSCRRFCRRTRTRAGSAATGGSTRRSGIRST